MKARVIEFSCTKGPLSMNRTKNNAKELDGRRQIGRASVVLLERFQMVVHCSE